MDSAMVRDAVVSGSGRGLLTSATFRNLLLDGLAVLALALLPQLYFWRLFPANPVDQKTLIDGDFTQENFPLAVTAARALRDGALPLWNPYSNAGQPLLADPQLALAYPPTWWALTGIFGHDGESFLAFERLIPLHFGMAGVFTYALSRVLFGSRFGALLAAIVFAYCGFLTTYPIQQLPILRALVWLPLQVLGLWLALERRSLRWAAFCGAALGMAMLAGHPQTVFQEGIVLALVAGAWVYSRLTGPEPAGRAPTATLLFASLGCAGGVAAGLSAVQWVPTLEFLQQSNRVEVDYQFVSGGYAFWELPLDLLAPRILGGLPPYVGILPLVLAGIALTLRRSRIHAWATVVALVGLILSLGGNSFAYAGAYRFLPGFALFRDQERAIFMFAFGLAILAGSGGAVLGGVLTRADWRRLGILLRRLQVVLLAAVIVGAALYVAHINAEVSGEGFQRWRSTVHWFFFFVLMLGCSIGLLTLHARIPEGRPLLPALALGLVVLDLFTVSWDQPLQDTHPNELFRASEIVRRTAAEIGTARAVDQNVLNGYHGLIYGIPTINRIFAMHLERYEQATERLPQPRLWDLLNVGFVITREARPEYGERLVEERWQDLTNLLYRRPNPLGPAFVVPRARAVASGEEALAMVADPGFDPRTLVVVEDRDAQTLPQGGPGQLLAYRREWNDLEAQVSVPLGGYLVLSEVAYPGWRAEIDGREGPLLQANFFLRAMWLPPGEHRVRLTFQPPSAGIGLGVTALTLAALAVWAVLGVRSTLGTRRQVSLATGSSPVRSPVL